MVDQNWKVQEHNLKLVHEKEDHQPVERVVAEVRELLQVWNSA